MCNVCSAGSRQLMHHAIMQIMHADHAHALGQRKGRQPIKRTSSPQPTQGGTRIDIEIAQGTRKETGAYVQQHNMYLWKIREIARHVSDRQIDRQN